MKAMKVVKVIGSIRLMGLMGLIRLLRPIHSIGVSLLLAFVASLPLSAQHQLKEVTLLVTLQQDGSAYVRERRIAQMSDQGTEGFITFNNMGDIGVTNLEVRDEDDKPYEVEERWDVNRSRAEKTGKCGYHQTNEGVELCWGIGRSGMRTYYISYTLTNLVKSYDDYDGFCHSFYEVSNSPAEEAAVYISVEGDTLTKRDVRVWSFGFQGWKGITKSGVVFASADSCSLRNGDGIIVLMELEKGILHPTAKRQGTFKDLVKRPALIDSDYDMTIAMGDTLDSGTVPSSLMGGINGTGHVQNFYKHNTDDDDGDRWAAAIAFLIIGGIIIYVIVNKMKENMKWQRMFKQDYERLTGMMGGQKWDDVPYWREPPLEGNLLKSGLVLRSVTTIMRLAHKTYPGFVSFSLQHLCEALVLRIFYKGGITFDTDIDHKGNTRKLFRICPPQSCSAKQRDSLLANMNSYSITMDKDRENAVKAVFRGQLDDDGMEHALHDMLYKASNDDHLLQPEELRMYVNKHMEELRPLADALYIFAEGREDDTRLVTDEVKEVLGFLHYLKDFSLVGERHIEEVALWKEYLVFATYYGIADQVRADMKKVAPDVAQLDEIMRLLSDLSPITTVMASSFVETRRYLTVAEHLARRSSYRGSSSSSSRSSGGSGRSSYSGGGGHSGGGGSGFR